MAWRIVLDACERKWHALERVVAPRERRGVPGWRVEAASGALLRVMSAGRPRLWARVGRGALWGDLLGWPNAGIWWLRAARGDGDPGVGAVPPIRADDARAIVARARGEVLEAWARHFARALDASPNAPLYAGTWWLRAASVALDRERVDAALAPGAHRWFGWWAYGGHRERAPLVATRRPPREDAARVKAWRKVARDGALPPVLVTYVRGLEAWVLLDGHDRLRAAQLEGVTPGALELVAGVPQPVGPDPHPVIWAWATARAAEAPAEVEAVNAPLLQKYENSGAFDARTRVGDPGRRGALGRGGARARHVPRRRRGARGGCRDARPGRAARAGGRVGPVVGHAR